MSDVTPIGQEELAAIKAHPWIGDPAVMRSEARLIATIEVRDAEIAELRAEVREWLCSACNTVYPGPPQKGLACVQCPKCGGATAPRYTVEAKQAQEVIARLGDRLAQAGMD